MSKLNRDQVEILDKLKECATGCTSHVLTLRYNSGKTETITRSQCSNILQQLKRRGLVKTNEVCQSVWQAV